MKKLVTFVLIVAMVLAVVPVCADYDDVVMDGEEVVQVFYIEPIEKMALVPAQRKIQPLREYEWDSELIDVLAQIYWAETGANGPRTAMEKLAITQLVWNRAHYGSPFPSDLLEVCKQKGEFNRGRISDRNRQTARDNLNKVRSQAEGFWQGIDVNLTDAIYMTREGGSGILTFQDDVWVTIYRVE